jgi:hypothetical protein
LRDLEGCPDRAWEASNHILSPGMGLGVLRSRGVLREQSSDKQVLDMGRDVDGETKQNVTNIEESHFALLMQGLQRVARLQEEVTTTQINFRQKRREAAFKRETVWDLDEKFMRELQKLIAQGRGNLQGDFKRLEELADECQAARDVLGPVEQENIEAEQRWEGQIWSLRQAENQVYRDFETEFCVAESYPPASPSVDSSHYESPSEPESEIFENDIIGGQSSLLAPSPAMTLPRSFVDANQPRNPELHAASHGSKALNPTLLGLEDHQTEATPLAMDIERWDSDSGIGDIDRAPQTWITQGLIGPHQRLPARHYTSELYQNLQTDFGTKRDRINRWLENNALASRIEATSIFTILKDQMNAENEQVPSNWAQLVVAYWELDGAAKPEKHEPCPSEKDLSDKRRDAAV